MYRQKNQKCITQIWARLNLHTYGKPKNNIKGQRYEIFDVRTTNLIELADRFGIVKAVNTSVVILP